MLSCSSYLPPPTTIYRITKWTVDRGPIRQKSLFHTSQRHGISQTKLLPSWDLSTFRSEAFNPAVPARLPHAEANLPPACTKWFIHKHRPSSPNNDTPIASELQTTFWSDFKEILVPLELTSTPPKDSKNDDNTTDPRSEPSPNLPEFQRVTAPLDLLLTHLECRRQANHTASQISIYLAQCTLDSLPGALQDDLPTPSLVTSAGRGDIYSSSLWLGHSPTYTPLHRDPNPNLLVQLCGQKQVRLFPPAIGDAIFDHIQETLGSGDGGRNVGTKSFRGEEMMQGAEKELLTKLVWGSEAEDDDGGEGKELREKYASEAHLSLGQALFIPKGWWHSVKGVGDGVTASANWWFR